MAMGMLTMSNETDKTRQASSSDKHEQRGQGQAQTYQDQTLPDLGLVVLLLRKDDTELGLEYQQH